MLFNCQQFQRLTRKRNKPLLSVDDKFIKIRFHLAGFYKPNQDLEKLESSVKFFLKNLYLGKNQRNEYLEQQQRSTRELTQQLRGGGCGTSNMEKKIHSQSEFVENKTTLPNYFLNDLQRHLIVICNQAQAAYDEKQKEEILISVQWFITMREHFNRLCIDTRATAGLYDLIFGSIPKLLKSAVIYLRISGFLCLQTLQISNDLARVLFTFFMQNDKRFLKIQDKEMLEDLIVDFETQLNIEAQNIWVAGAEFEITMIKAVVQSSPSNSDEGQKLLFQFIGGLAKSVLTMSPSENFIDSLIGGAKFLYKAYQSNSLKKKYEVYYYFESLKWYIIYLLKDDVPVNKLIQLLSKGYGSYIENSNDWLLNFCWVKMIASLISYRPLISKQDLSLNQQEQSKFWNQLIQQKCVLSLSSNKSLGRMALFQNQSSKLTAQLNQILRKLGLKSFEKFSETILETMSPQTNEYFSFCVINQNTNQQRNYLELLFQPDTDLYDQIESQSKLFIELEQIITQIFQDVQTLQLLDVCKRQDKTQEIIQNIQQAIRLSFFTLLQTTVIRNQIQILVQKYNIIIYSITLMDLEYIDKIKQEIQTIEKQIERKNLIVQLFEIHNQTIESLTNIEVSFSIMRNNQLQQSTIQQIQNLPKLLNQYISLSRQYFSMIDNIKNINQNKSFNLKEKRIKYQLKDPLQVLNNAIQNIINQNSTEIRIQFICNFYTQGVKLFEDSQNKLVFYNIVQYQIIDLISQMINFKETLQQMSNFLEKNIPSIFQIITQDENIVNQDILNGMLAKQLKMILLFFSYEEKLTLDNKQQDQINLEQILSLLNKNSEQLQDQHEQESLNFIQIRQAMAFVYQFLQQYQKSSQKLSFIKDQIISIYQKLNVKSPILSQSPLNQKEKNTQSNSKQINDLIMKIGYLIANIASAIEKCKNIQSGLSDQIILFENVQTIKLQLNLQNECDQQYFQDYEINLNQQLKDPFQQLNQFKIDFAIVNIININQGATENLDNILMLIDQMENRITMQEDSSIISNAIQGAQQIIQDAKDLLNDQKYKVRQCVVICLMQIQSSTFEQPLIKFCQDKLVQLWGSERDERVKSLLKNTELLEMQKNLFSSDLKSFSKRLQIEMEKQFEKINDLEQRIHQEGDQEIRLQLQQDLEQKHREYEDYLDNINEMSQKLDIGIQFLKDIKRSVAQLKLKIDKLQDTVNIIGDDVRKLRGKSYAELFNIRKRKVLDSMQLRSINQIYIPLKCQEWDPISGKQQGNPSILLHENFENQAGEINEFLQNDSKEKDVLLLRGIAGSGKSRAAGKIEEFLWQKYDQKESIWFPIYVSLPTIKEPKFNLIDQALESEYYQFDKIQIREFKEALHQEGLKIILILDSYDEMKQECIQSNLFHTNRIAQDLFGHLNDAKLVKNQLKLIITTRSEILTSSSYQTWFYGEKLESLKEVELLGFDQEQKQKYLQEYTMLSMKKEFLELNNYNQANQLSDLLNFWKKVLEFLHKYPNTREDYLITERQANQICTIVKQEKCYHKISKDQLVNLEKKLIDLWSVKKFEKLIASAQIQHILTTPFMMEIVVQVLPSMTKKYQDASGFKDLFISNFIKLKKKEHLEILLTTKYKQKKNPILSQQINTDFDKKENQILANKIWDQLQNEKFFTKFSLVDKINQNDLQTIDQVNIVIKALIVKKLTVFDFYFTFVEFYHLQQIRKQQELGRPCNQESLLIDLFNFSQSLAIDMMLRQLTQIKYNSKGQLNLKYVKNKNDQQDWQDTYFNDFEPNGEYKKLTRSCILLLQKGSNHSFTHKSIQEFYVGHFLLNTLEELQNFDEIQFQQFVDIYKWEDNQLKTQIINQQQLNLPILDIQRFCQNIYNSLYNSNQLNLSTDSYKGVITLINEEIKKQKKLKQKLIKIVKLSSISQQFIRASSNSIYLLGQMNEYLGKNNLQNIQLTDTDLLGLSFYDSNLQGSVFKNVNINSCNFNKVNLINAKWTDIKCNELHSVICEKDYLRKIVFSQSGQIVVTCMTDAVYMCNIQEGTNKLLIEYKNIACNEYFGEQYKYSGSYEINQMVFSPDETLLAVGWYQALGYDYIAYEFYVIQLLDIKSGQSSYLQGQLFKIQQIIFSPDNQQLTACGQKPQILIWNIKEIKEISSLEGHEDQVNCIAYSQDGRILASCSNDKNVRLWKLQDFSQFQILKGHTKSVNQLAFQPNGIFLASCSEDSTVRLWSMITFENICIFQAHTMNVIKLSFLPDGLTLVSLGTDKLIIVWDIKEQKQLRCIEGSQEYFGYYACSSNGKLLAQQNHSEIQIWDLTVGKIVTVFEGQSKRIIDMAFQPGVLILASINEQDSKIKLWDAQTEKNKNQLDGHESSVFLIAFSPDSTKLASRGNDATIRIWNVQNGKQIARLDTIKIGVIKILFSQDGQYLLIKLTENLSNILWYFKDDQLIQIDQPQKQIQQITSQIISQPNGNIIAWGMLENNSIPIINLYNVKEKTQKQLLGHQRSVTTLVFTTDGEQLISYGDDKSIKIWDMQNYTKIKHFADSKIINSTNNDILGFLDTSKKKITIYNIKENKQLEKIEVTNGQLFSLCAFALAQAIGQTIKLWKINGEKQVTVLEGHTQAVQGLAFSPNGQILVSFSKEATIKVWCMEDQKEKATLQGHASEIQGITFSPNGQVLASYSKDKIIILWEMKDFKELRKLVGHEKNLLYIIFSPDITMLAAADEGCKIILWNVKDGTQIKLFENSYPKWSESIRNSMAFSPDNNFFICYSNILTRNVIWDLKQNQQHCLIAGHSAIRDVTFTSDSQILVTVIKSQSFILLWDVNQGQLLELINNDKAFPTETVISYDCQLLIMYGNDKDIQIWNTQTGKNVKTLIGHKHIVSQIFFSPDGLYLVSGSWDQTIRVWNIKNWQQMAILEGHKHFVDIIVFSPDRLTIVSAGRDNTIRFWDITSFQQIRIIEDSQQIIRVKTILFSPEGLMIAWFCIDQKAVYILTLKGEEEALIISHKYEITDILVFQQNILICCDKQSAKIWDLVKRESIITFEIQYIGELKLSTSLNGQMFAVIKSLQDQKQFTFFNLEYNQETQTQEEHTNEIIQILFSYDDQVLASCGRDGMIKLWDVSQKIPMCYKTLAIYQPLTASNCQISGAEITSNIGWNLKQLFIQKGALE